MLNNNSAKHSCDANAVPAPASFLSIQEMLAKGDAERIEIFPDHSIITIRTFNDCTIKMALNDNLFEVPRIILEKGCYEKPEAEMMHRVLSCLNKGFTVFDIGSNIGYFSLCYKTWFPEATVYAFEPLVYTYEGLINNIQLNNIKICANNFGFFDSEKTLEFYYNSKESGATSIQNIREINESSKVECKVTTMDSYVEKNNMKPDFIKCDVEGAELFVFKGGIETIEKHKPVVFTEMLRKWSAKFGYHPNQIISLFSNLGYSCYVIDGARLKPFIEVVEETVETNYFFIHSTRLENFKALL